MAQGKKSRKGVGGAPLKEFSAADWKKVDGLCKIHCTGEEIAAIMDVDYDTLKRIIKTKYSLSFSQYFDRKSASGKMSLRRKQYSKANSGNTAMLIWLGKQWLGQKDRIEETKLGPDGGPVEFNIKANELSDDELARIIKGKS